MKVLLCTLCFIVASVVDLFAQAASVEINFWQRSLEKNAGKQVFDLLAKPAEPKWPIIRTIYWIDKQPEADRGKYNGGKTLALSLVKAMKDGFNSNIPATLRDLDQEISSYVSAAKRMQSSDSYTNRVLSDCFYELVLFKLSGWLIQNNNDFDAVDARIKALSIPRVSVSSFLVTCKNEDPVMDLVAIDASSVGDPNNSLLEQLRNVGFNEGSVMEILFKSEDSKTISLIEKPSVIQLMAKVAGTESSFRALLGMCEYLRRGGGMDDGSLSEYKTFRRLMGKDSRAYAATWLGKAFLEIGDLQTLRALHVVEASKSTRERTVFFDRLFN